METLYNAINDLITNDNETWGEFVKWFRDVKGHSDWTENEIEMSRNNQDHYEFWRYLLGRGEKISVLDIDDLARWCDNNLCPSDGMPQMFSNETLQDTLEKALIDDYAWGKSDEN